jgi:hypothetical protein
MATLTTYFGWQKPVVNDPIDQDQWGNELNSNLDAQDTLVYALSTTAIGITRPTYAAAGTLWMDNTTTTWNFNVYSGTTDILIGTVNTITNTFTPAGLAALTSKGDLLTRDATMNVRLPVGTNGQVLVADSTQDPGLKWSNQIVAWVTFSWNGSVATILASNNVQPQNVNPAGVVRNSAGNFTITFTNALPSAFYVPSGTCQKSNTNNALWLSIDRTNSPTATNCTIATVDNLGNSQDPQLVSVMFVGG